jgi:glycosyltransferase involved in cell wall biosynthesis
MVHYATGRKADRYTGKWFYREKDFYPNVDVIRTHVSESYHRGFLGRFWSFMVFMFSSSWAGMCYAKGRYDVIIATSPPLFIGVTAILVSRLRRIPFVFELRDLWPESIIDMGLLKSKLAINLSYGLENFIYKRASLINILIPNFRDYLVNRKGVAEDRLIHIPNGADFSLSEKVLNGFNRSQFRKEHSLDDYFVITYVGAHGPANHLMQLLEAADQLKGTKVHFQLIGAGPEKQLLINWAKNRGLDNVVFVDPVPKAEVFRYIAASDMGTSVLKKAEIFKGVMSNKTFDYMGCKIPILMLIDGLSRHMIEEADCGIYAEPENIPDIVEKVKLVLGSWDNKTLRQKGENGYHYAKQHFDRMKLAENYINLIKDKLNVE